MAVSSTTTLANVIREVYNPHLAELGFFNDYLMQMPGAPQEQGDAQPRGLFPILPSKGGKNWTWPVRSSTTAASALTEGGAWPAPGNNTYLQGSLAYSLGYYARSVEITGHAIDALRDEGAIVEALDRELTGALQAMQDAYSVAALGSTGFGLQLAIDSAGTYAGIDRATYSAWGSHETALGGAMSRSAIRDEIEALKDNDRGVRHQDLAILIPVNQESNIMALAGAGAGVPLQTQGGGTLDLGFTGVKFEGLPVYAIPDMTDTIALIVHRPSCYWVMHKAPQIIPQETGGYSSGWALVSCFILVMEQPNWCAKVTGITA